MLVGREKYFSMTPTLVCKPPAIDYRIVSNNNVGKPGDGWARAHFLPFTFKWRHWKVEKLAAGTQHSWGSNEDVFTKSIKSYQLTLKTFSLMMSRLNVDFVFVSNYLSFYSDKNSTFTMSGNEIIAEITQRIQISSIQMLLQETLFLSRKQAITRGE